MRSDWQPVLRLQPSWVHLKGCSPQHIFSQLRRESRLEWMLMQVSEMSEQDTDRRTGPTWRGMLLPLVTVLASSHFTVPPPSMHCFVHCPLGGLNSLGTVLWFRIASCSRTFFLGPFSVDTKHTLESEWEVLYGNHHFHTMPCALDASRPPHQALNWVTLLSAFLESWLKKSSSCALCNLYSNKRKSGTDYI